MRYNRSGFTIFELLAVLAIFVILLGALFLKMDESQEVSAISRDESEMVQNLQDALILLNTEMRMAGFPPASHYDFDYLQAPSTPRDLVAAGLVEAGPQSVQFQGDINGDGEVDYVHYYLSGSTPPFSLNRFGGKLNRIDGSLPSGSPQKLSEQVESFHLRYFDKFGVETIVLQNIRQIEVSLTMRTKRVDPMTHVFRSATRSVRIHPLNL